MKRINQIMPNSKRLAEDIDTLENKITQVTLDFSSIKEKEKLLQEVADKMSLLVSTDDDLMSRYQANLLVFKEYYPEIFNFFEEYVPKKYIVDASDGFLNAINVETSETFYQAPSYLSTKLQFDQFCLHPNIKKFNFNADGDNEAKFIHVDSVDAMIDLLPKNKKSLDQRIQVPSNQFSSLIIFGVGAGYHLEMFAQQYDVACLYIVEPDLDLFFLSLFSINWHFILNSFDEKGSQIHISLGEQQNTFFEDLMKKSATNGRYQMAHVAGYIHYQSESISGLLTEFNRRYLEMGQGWGFFDDAVMAIGHTLENIHNKVGLLKKCAINNTQAAKLPVFIVGNGPSLDSAIETIKLLQHKAIIISCGSALSALYEYGIKPDFHCEQERTFPVAEKIEHYCPSEFLDDIVLLGPTTVHPTVYEIFNRSIMAAKMNEPSSSLLLRDKQGADLFSAYHFINPTVANTALVMGYNLGFKSFYLFGVDLGHKQGGNHHSKKSMYYNEEEKDLDLYRVNADAVTEVDGNYGGKFICDSFFYQSNANLSKQVLGFDDLHCFNLSDGAAITGCVPMQVASLKEILMEVSAFDKKDLVNKITKASTHTDDDSLFNRLVDDLDYQYFDDVCENLLTLNNKPVITFKEATVLLLNNTIMLNTLTDHADALLKGTIMHMQVVLTQLLYGAKDKKSSVDIFNQGMVFYCQFIEKAASYYRENAEQAHYIEDCRFIVKLRNK